MKQTSLSHYSNFSLEQWLHYLESIHHFEIDLGLDRISEVAKRLSIDLSFAKVITVAGTNGKGTTCAFIENALLSLQHSVAVYSSPHIKRFNERLRVNKIDVNDQEFINAFEQVEQLRSTTSLTYYEFTTLASFIVLMKRKPEYIILEVGLGGRLDATNIIDADISVVTSIDIDHQAFLGSDRETIGREKAGIFRASRPAIIGEKTPPHSVIQYAKEIGADIICREKTFNIITKDNSWQWQCGREIVKDLIEPHIPLDNVATALSVLYTLGVSFTTEIVNQWITQTKVPGRLEYFRTHCDVLLDVAHNPHAARHLAYRINCVKQKYDKILAIVAMMADKDIAHCIEPFNGLIDLWYVCGLPIERAEKPENIVTIIKQTISSTSNINYFDNANQAFTMANQKSSKTDLIVVFGSFYTVSEVRDLLN